MSGFTKLFSSIVTSTIWQEDAETKVVWVTMLALADANGLVDSTVPGLAHLARVPIEKTKEALHKFAEPDPHSRTKDFEGRRIQEIDGGWQLLNHSKYREKLDPDERREYFRRKKQEYRARLSKMSNSVQDCPKCPTLSKEVTQAEAEAEAEKENKDNSLSGSLSLEQHTEIVQQCPIDVQTNRMTPEQRKEYFEKTRLGAEARQKQKKTAYNTVVAKRREIELAGVAKSDGLKIWEQNHIIEQQTLAKTEIRQTA